MRKRIRWTTSDKPDDSPGFSSLEGMAILQSLYSLSLNVQISLKMATSMASLTKIDIEYHNAWIKHKESFKCISSAADGTASFC